MFPIIPFMEVTQMAFPKDTQVTVTSDEMNYYIEAGPNGFTYPKADLALDMSGTQDDIANLKANIAKYLSLAGVDPNNDIAVKQVLESTMFKMFR